MFLSRVWTDSKASRKRLKRWFPKTQVQLCLVHLLRHSLSYVSYKQRKEVAADLKSIYTAATLEEAENRLLEFSEKWEDRYPVVARSWSSNWARIVPMFAFTLEIQRAIERDQCDRIIKLQLAKNYQKPRSVSERRSGL